MLTVFETGVLRRIFGLKKQEITGWWRKGLMGYFTICSLHRVILM
jgi:hypothetical protein